MTVKVANCDFFQYSERRAFYGAENHPHVQVLAVIKNWKALR